jgi:hypothetical protein
MSKMWMLMRGEFDKNNAQNYRDDTDVWIQLSHELAQGEALIWWKDSPECNKAAKIVNPDYIFARGGFDYYIPVLKKFPDAYKIRYGAGKRYMPESNIKYNLILVDTEKQKQKVLAKFPKANVHTWLKPAARHFKPIDVKKKYDVCYVANCHSKFQEKIKRVQWLYKTAPKDLKILHLGKSSIKPPKHIKVKQVLLSEMPKYISKCRTMIVPYKGYDSEPRVIGEALACNVDVFPLISVNQERLLVYPKDLIWKCIKGYNKVDDESVFKVQPVTIEQAATHIRKLIGG